jgi:nucleotide-binding universal stress UspA family protein
MVEKARNSLINKIEGGKEMIPKIKRILYATDLSKNSAYAAYYAIGLAQTNNAKITVLHVVEPLPALVRFYGGTLADETRYYDRIKSTDLGLIKKRLQDICERIDKELGFSCVQLVSDILVEVGHPVEEILRVGNEAQCDVFVLGTHGKGFLKNTFLGSVSRMVLDRTRKPVLVIPLPSEEVKIDWDEIS